MLEPVTLDGDALRKINRNGRDHFFAPVAADYGPAPAGVYAELQKMEDLLVARLWIRPATLMAEFGGSLVVVDED